MPAAAPRGSLSYRGSIIPCIPLSFEYFDLTGSTDVEGVVSQLSDDQQRSHAHHESAESTVPKLEYSLRGCLGLCTASSGGMVEQDNGSRRTAAGRAVYQP